MWRTKLLPKPFLAPATSVQLGFAAGARFPKRTFNPAGLVSRLVCPAMESTYSPARQDGKMRAGWTGPPELPGVSH